MTYLDAAAQVLQVSGRPMTVHEITSEALRRSLIAPGGKTPEATMMAALYVDAKKVSTRFARLSRPGPTKAERNSVRWALRGPIVQS